MAKSQENGVKKGPWSIEEDKVLFDYIEKNGQGNWRTIPKQAGLNRCGKSCRLRWKNYLRPGIKRGRFSAEEEAAIIALHGKLGNKWSRIAAELPGRTDNEIKNFWNTHLRKKLLRKVIESQTSKPIPDLNLLNLSQAQLLSVSNLYNFMNPNLDTALSLQASVIELMKIQILQNMLQTVNPNLLQCIRGNLELEVANTDLTLDPRQAQSMIADFTNVSPLLNQQQASTSSTFPCFDSDIVQRASLDDSLNGSSNMQTTEYSLPLLVSAAPESSTPNQMQSFEPSHVKPVEAPDHCDVFDAWENLVDDEAISSFWKDILG